MGAVGLKVWGANADAKFGAVHGFLQRSDQVRQGTAYLLGFGQLDQQLADEIRPIVEKIIFPQGTVAGGFDRQPGFLPVVIEALGFVDDVLVTAPEAVVDPLQTPR
jgi:hypothetical protein